jgi:gluconolactonase
MSAFETLASGFRLVEGPTVAPDGGLYFSDVLGGGVFHRAPGGEITTVVPKRRGVGGIAVHADGGIVCSGRDILHVRGGENRTVLSIQGLPGWNDLCTDSSGRVYAGSVRFRVFDPEAEAVPGECWRVALSGQASELYGGVVHCNGIGLSPDDRTLYHSDTRSRVLRVHDLDETGAAVNPREIAVGGMPDGLALDESGCVWVAIADGGRVDRFTPEGKLDRSLEVPARMVTSVCFDGRSLIVVTADNAEDASRRGTIFRTGVDVAGAPVHPARVRPQAAG